MALQIEKQTNFSNRKDLLEYMLIFFLIYSTDSLLFKTNANFSLRYISWAIICLIGGLAAIKYARRRYYKELYAIIIFIVLSMIVKFDLTGGYVFKILLLFCGLFLSELIKWEDFAVKYVNCMFLLALVAIVCYVFHSRLVNLRFFPIVYNTVGSGFRCLILANLPLVEYDNIWNSYRSYGIFWEPGVFQAYLNIAVMLCLFGKAKLTKCDFVKIGILSLALLSTLSTAGYIVLAVLIFTFLIKNGRISGKTLIAICAVIVVTYVVTQTNLSYFVFNKLNQRSASVASTNARVYSVYGNLYIAILHPFGVGPNSLEEMVYAYTKKYYGVDGYSIVNTVLMNFSIWGWFYGAYYMGKLADFARSFKENKIVTVLLFVALVLILSNEAFIYSLMFSYFIFYHENGSSFYIKLFRD